MESEKNSIKEDKMDTKEIKKILIIKMFAIGDVLMATPVLSALRKNFKDVHISWLVGNWSKGILEKNPDIDELIYFDDNILVKYKFFQTFSLINKLRMKKFDLILVLHKSMMINLFSYLIGGKYRLGFKSSGSFFLTDIIHTQKNQHQVENYLQILNCLGLNVDTPKLNIFIDKDDEKYAEDFFRKEELKEDDIIIGMCPGGGRNPKNKYFEKRWQIENYLNLCKKLIEKYFAKIIIFGDEEEKKLSEFFVEEYPKNIISVCGKTTISQLASLIKKCKIFIGSDSGPIHIASAVNTPVVALFGPTNPKVWGPCGEKSIIISKKISCSPCYKDDGNFKPCPDNQCMKKITVEDIEDIVDNILRDVK